MTIHERRQRLMRIAGSQQGYFTTRQAISAGYSDSVHGYHVATGAWQRPLRGIYRLTDYPEHGEEHLVLYALWSADRSGAQQGVYSHETALAIYQLSDIMPAKLHMTVPVHFRRSSVPSMLVLHRGEVSSSDRQRRQGFDVTTPRRALHDLLIQPSISLEQLSMALGQAYRRGWISDHDLATWKNLREIDGSLLQTLRKAAGIG